MPTENRPSNTEQMVSVPRDKLEEALRIVGNYGFKEFAEEVRTLLVQSAAQHQGEPVGYRWEQLGGNGWCYGKVLPEIIIGAWQELYTHPPTTDGFSAGDMADQGAKAFGARDPEVQELRAKLAEAQEVLRDCIEVGELDAETQWKAERVSKGRRLYVDDRALASIADPSAPIERDQGIPGTSFQRLNMLANQGE